MSWQAHAAIEVEGRPRVAEAADARPDRVGLEGDHAALNGFAAGLDPALGPVAGDAPAFHAHQLLRRPRVEHVFIHAGFPASVTAGHGGLDVEDHAQAWRAGLAGDQGFHVNMRCGNPSLQKILQRALRSMLSTGGFCIIIGFIDP